MRILAMVFALLMGTLAFSPSVAHAESGLQQAQTGSVDDLRVSLRGALNQSRQFLGNLMTEAKTATGMNDEQLFGVGVGLLTGLLAADVVGTAGLGTMVFAGAGGLFGKWVTSTNAK